MKRLPLALLLALVVPLAVQAQGFSDVSSSSPHVEAIEELQMLGIVQGYPDGTFREDNAINRAEFLKIVFAARSVGEEQGGEKNRACGFPDVPSHAWFMPSVCQAKEEGIVTGYPDGTFRPHDHIIMAEAAKIISKSFRLSPLEVATPLRVLPWYAGYMQDLDLIHAVPPSITSPGQYLTRGEMAYIIARVLHPRTSGRAGQKIDDTSTPSVPQGLSLIGWIPYWDQQNAFASFKDNGELFEYLSLFWYRITKEGTIAKYHVTKEDSSIIEFAHAHGVKVLALIANLRDYTEGSGWDSKRVERVIYSASARSAHIQDLLALVEEHHFDGINIDYEALPGRARQNFTDFIEELAEALHARGKLLAVALHPKTSESNPAEDNGSHAQDWEKIARAADQLHLMTYDEHYTDSAPGPIASLGWVDRVLDYAVNIVGVPAEKTFLGLPLYAQEWHEYPSGAFDGVPEEITQRRSEVIRQQHDAELHWDRQSASPYFRYFDHDTDHIVWLEDTRSLKEKLGLLARYGIANVALWRLGGETEALWHLLHSLKD